MAGFWNVGGGSEDAILGVKVYGNKYRDAWWFGGIVMPVYRFASKIDRAYDWLRYRLVPRHQYHLVNTGLKPAYYDCDTLMLNACFALLCRYVEDEMGGEDAIRRLNQQLLLTPDHNAPEGLESGQAARQASAVDLYVWWKRTKPADEKEYDRMLAHLYGRKRSMKKQEDGTSVYSTDEPWTDEDKAMNVKFRALEDKIDTDEQAMLHRLIDIRRSLWT